MESHVRGTEVFLGEVAEISGDPNVVASVEKISLGYAPSPGYSRLIWNHKISTAITKYDSQLQVQFRGQRATRVWPAVETIQADALKEAAEQRILEVAGTGDYVWELREPIHDLEVPAAATGAILRAKPARGSLEAGVLSVPVEVLVAEETYRTLWTSWSVRAYKTVPVLTEPVPAGRRVRPDQLENRRIEASAARSKALTRDMLLGATAARDLIPGEVVTELDVHRPPAVTTGDTVFLEVRKGPIAARVPAVARQSGSIGDRIRVIRTDGPNAEVSAVIVSRDLVEIDLAKERL